MIAFLVSAVSALGSLVANTASAGCIVAWVDEPVAPKSMIER